MIVILTNPIQNVIKMVVSTLIYDLRLDYNNYKGFRKLY